MKLAEGIQKHGFRKWYERELLQSHAHMALCFVCVIGLFAAFEASSRFKGLSDQLIDIAAVVICAGTGLWALRRYLYLLGHAEATAQQAQCPKCGTHGRLELVQTAHTGADVQVRCKKCGHPWGISTD